MENKDNLNNIGVNREQEKKDRKLDNRKKQDYELDDLKENYKLGIEYYENVEKD